MRELGDTARYLLMGQRRARMFGDLCSAGASVVSDAGGAASELREVVEDVRDPTRARELATTLDALQPASDTMVRAIRLYNGSPLQRSTQNGLLQVSVAACLPAWCGR